jgi:hypothetical protein
VKLPKIRNSKRRDVPSPALRIALIEPEPAPAAELGQLLSDALRECAIELSDAPAADLILMDDAILRQPTFPPVPTIRFGRSSDGSYAAHALHTGGAEAEQIAFAMPLTDGIRCAALMWNT